MTSTSAVLAADGLEDYALAVTAAAAVARTRGLAQCYPLLAGTEPDTFRRVLRDYHVEWLRLQDLFPASSFIERSNRVRAALFPLEVPSVAISPRAAMDQMATSVSQCLCELRPLEFDLTASTAVDSHPSWAPHALLLKRGSRHSIAAAYYAHSTGKCLHFVDDWQSALEAHSDAFVESYLLVDDYAAFGKSFLARILDSDRFRRASLGTGILTAFDESAFTRLVVRIQLSRYAPENPTDLERYRVITEHGNEMHMELDDGEFLCGAVPAGDPADSNLEFDCRPTCPHSNRRLAASLKVQHLLISSCNTFTLGDGVVGPQFRLLFRMLDGWCCSVTAPLKHALTGVAIPLMIGALARSGFSLGAITEWLNSVASYATEPDPAYVLLGDPATVLSPPRAELQEPDAHLMGNSMALAGELKGRCAAEWRLPADSLRVVAGKNDGKLALVPLCSGLRVPDVYFAFRRMPGTDGWHLLLFSERELPRTRVQLAVTGSAGVPSWLHDRALESIRELYRMQAFGIPIETIQRLEAGILLQLRFGVGYPRLIEYLIGELMIRNITGILDRQLAQARIAILDQLIELTADRLWLSQHYGQHYSSVRRAPSGTPSCPYCASETTSWCYDDEVTGRSARVLLICARCGIIADHPSEKQLDVSIEKIRELPLHGVRVAIAATNRTTSPFRATVGAHFHEWRNLGISLEGGHLFLDLLPGETIKHEFVFHFAKQLGDYMQDIHVFSITEDFAVSCFTQKVTSTHRALQQQLVSVGAIATTY